MRPSLSSCWKNYPEVRSDSREDRWLPAFAVCWIEASMLTSGDDIEEYGVRFPMSEENIGKGSVSNRCLQ
jgi:hypothetical protein